MTETIQEFAKAWAEAGRPINKEWADRFSRVDCPASICGTDDCPLEEVECGDLTEFNTTGKITKPTEQAKPYLCPSCGKRVSHVHIFVTEENRYELELEDDWVHWYGQESVDATEKSADAECPECGEKIGDPWDGVEDINSWALKLLNSILESNMQKLPQKDKKITPHFFSVKADA